MLILLIGFSDCFMKWVSTKPTLSDPLTLKNLEQLGFGEKEICLLICISMFDVGRTDITELDDREGIE